jgi:hypothetical protein
MLANEALALWLVASVACFGRLRCEAAPAETYASKQMEVRTMLPERVPQNCRRRQ